MQKKRLNLEYPLAARKPDILWQLISTAHGLEHWLADRVIEEDGVLSLTWGDPWGEHHTMKACITEREKLSHIRLRWLDEEEEEAFWEMRIGRSELTGYVCLYVTDYAPADEIDDLHQLWEGNMERLHQSSGL